MPPGSTAPRRLLALLLLGGGWLAGPALAESGAEAPEPHGPLQGRPVAEVIEAFRGQGYPLAYSSQLVPATLRVLDEPAAPDPLGIVAEILRPHGLALRRSDGIYLVIREARGPPAGAGSLLVIARDRASAPLQTPVSLVSRPGLPAVESLGPGIVQAEGVGPGRYALEISAPGFETALRTVLVQGGGRRTLHVRLTPASTTLEELTVTASRYVLFSNSQFFIDQRAVQNLPGNGEDPLRAAHRLPGTATGGWSAKSHFRGGEENETAIFLNGLQLVDPFHIRDFHNIFSSIDARTISGVEAYTGGFPAGLGDRMSGMLLLRSSKPDRPRRTELGVSLFNTSLLSAGFTATGKVDWLVSARRSNLDLVLDPEDHGEPTYNDFFASLGVNASPRTRVSINALRADDSVLVITENKPDEQEFSTSETRNEYLWVQVENDFSSRLSASTVLAASAFSNARRAVANAPEQLLAQVRDDREVDIHTARQDWSFDASQRHFLKWGWQAQRQEARYRYLSHANYAGFYLAYPGVPETLDRDIRAAPEGEGYALYLSDRIQVAPATTLELGLRWDRQGWIGPGGAAQASPRINFLHRFDAGVELRLTWGHYHQSQATNELQVEDGVERFFPAQQADHLIAGVRWRLHSDYSLRLEAYRKAYSDLRPRFENLTDPLPLIPELEPDRVRIAPDSATAYGFEATLEYDAGGDLNWWASYTWSEVTDSVGGLDERRNWDQRHSLQAGLAWERGPWIVGLAAKVHSGWPTTGATLQAVETTPGAEPELNLVFGPRNAERLNTFASFDFRVARQWPVRRGQLTAFFELSNALGRDNECCVDYDLADEGDLRLERSVDHWLGVTPALGVLWEF